MGVHKYPLAGKGVTNIRAGTPMFSVLYRSDEAYFAARDAKMHANECFIAAKKASGRVRNCKRALEDGDANMEEDLVDAEDELIACRSRVIMEGKAWRKAEDELTYARYCKDWAFPSWPGFPPRWTRVCKRKQQQQPAN